ncbi:hypothetical protein SISNIDRAFT_404347 [Sistotremastrum niveocremeum HHB9708]|uniref:RPA43 OB domain-containing protein n=1 Tax=Sistotremastrum niveocremeum HHB9708 TaxID=1314777 RepID=A0A164ZXI0_9AGAM|nr:hypothetical protein SISNIDRAFT_404347 [Sistotremastrum niveocremeum HHB9708]
MKDKKRKHGNPQGNSKERQEFTLMNASMTLSIPPLFATEPRRGALEMLDSLLMRHIPALNGVLITHSNMKFTSSTAQIINECPFAVVPITFDALVWAPRIGSKLVGKVSLASPDHLGLILHSTFNASIPRQHIRTDEWEFEYGPAENDPEFGQSVSWKTDEQTVIPDGEQTGVEGEAEAEEPQQTGKWIRITDGESIGGEEGLVEFTVIGYVLFFLS